MPSMSPSLSRSSAVSRRAAAACSALAGIAINDGRAAFRRDHAVDRIFQHEHLIADAQRQRAAAAAFADDKPRSPEPADAPSREGCGRWLRPGRALRRRCRDTRRGIEKRNDRPAELRRHLHRAQGFAITFGFRHAEVAQQLLLRVAALLLADEQYGRPSSFAMPQTMAASSPNRRSPWISWKSVKMRCT